MFHSSSGRRTARRSTVVSIAGPNRRDDVYANLPETPLVSPGDQRAAAGASRITPASGALAAWGPWAYLTLMAVPVGESSALVGLVVPGETFALLGGALAARGDLVLAWVIVAVVVGAGVGDSIGFALGRHFGGCRDHGWLRRVWSCQRMSRVRRFLDHHGGWTIFLGRFVGFARPLAPFAAGAAGMRYRLFLFSNVAGAAVWGTATVLAGYFLGPAVERSLRVGRLGLAAAIALAVLGVVMWRRRRPDAGTAPAVS